MPIHFWFCVTLLQPFNCNFGQTDLESKKGTSRCFLPPFSQPNSYRHSVKRMAMLIRRLRNLSSKPASFTAPFIYSSLSLVENRFLSSTRSADVFSDVADVTEEDDSVYPVPPVTSSVEMVNMPTVVQPRVVVYDGVCHLCHRGVKWVIQADKDKKIKFCCLQSRAAEPYLRLCGLDREDVLRRFLFVEGHGLYHQGYTAAMRVLSYLPMPYSALSTLAVVPAPLRDAIYDYVAERRYDWFGRSSDCLVLREQDLLDRFIDRDEMMDKSRSL